ncbi:amidophosphoribosyltransferase [Mollisia scopiformis]|uniref:Amidophosphoribosyltransferase n=1 Tax=Mollisia scopiformis TaxID=149040 RepID=A0A194WVA1_MOLSC|nr:amidophosphoribosyltransferase [Mollisia scopiformis]KUJ11895.1 amidophosphoribosyltransferase [Mollisia scopiformis]
MCGILALISGNIECNDAAVDLHEALYALQHRGQDGCGIATSHKSGRIYSCKGKGLASKVFRDGELVPELPGFMGLGHLRYPTAGTSSNAESQPFYVSSPYGLLFSHNGNLLDTEKLKEYLDFEAHRHINTDSDSEIMLQVFASQLLQTDKRRVDEDDIFTGLENMYKMTVSGFAFCGMVAGFAIFGARDPNGIRPLVIGSRLNPDGKGLDYMLASDSPNSIIDGISVYESRQNMGLKLANTILKTLGQDVVDDIDIANRLIAVVAIPDSGIVPALSVAEALKRPYRHAFSRNRYIFRTFIMPNQESVVRAYNRNSILCGVCNMAREAGAKKVYFASSSPPVTHPHIYGIDLATSTELVAYNRDRKSIAASINADELIFLPLEGLEAACAELSPRSKQSFEIGVFCGRYVTPVSQGYLEKLEKTQGKPKAIDGSHNGMFVTVGDSVTTRPMVSERSDVSLHNLAEDH